MIKQKLKILIKIRDLLIYFNTKTIINLENAEFLINKNVKKYNHLIYGLNIIGIDTRKNYKELYSTKSNNYIPIIISHNKDTHFLELFLIKFLIILYKKDDCYIRFKYQDNHKNLYISIGDYSNFKKIESNLTHQIHIREFDKKLKYKEIQSLLLRRTINPFI